MLLHPFDGVPQPKITVQERQMGQDLCLFDSLDARQPVHILNDGAAIVWLLCDGERSVPSIAGEIADNFALPAD